MVYAVYVSKESDQSANGLVLEDPVPAYMRVSHVETFTGDARWTDTGGENGRGTVTVEDLTIPRDMDGVTIYIYGDVDTRDELIEAGVAPEEINGLTICNQGELSAPFLERPFTTDDPAVGGSQNPTCFTLAYNPGILNPSTRKAVVDVNGGDAEPGDLLRYTITLTNQGTPWPRWISPTASRRG